MKARTNRRSHALKSEQFQARALAIAQLVREEMQPKRIAAELGVKAPCISHYMTTLGCRPVYLMPDEQVLVRRYREENFGIIPTAAP